MGAVKYVPPVVRSGLSHDPIAFSDLDSVHDFGPSMTQQSQKDDADINVILRRFGVTGTVPVTSERALTYGEFEGIFDFQTAMNAVVNANRQFMMLPADLRTRFANDPQKFVEFCSDAGNAEELERMGLLSEAKVAELAKGRQAKYDADVAAAAAKLKDVSNGEAS